MSLFFDRYFPHRAGRSDRLVETCRSQADVHQKLSAVMPRGHHERCYIGLAAPSAERITYWTRQQTQDYSKSWAPGAFNAHHGHRVDICVDHDRNRKIARGSVFSHSAGLRVVFRASADVDRWLRQLIAAGRLRGLSACTFEDLQVRRREATGAITITSLRPGGLDEISICVDDPPAFESTWLEPFTIAAALRGFRENVEAEERFYGNRFIPGRSNLIDSRTPYRGVLKTRRTA